MTIHIYGDSFGADFDEEETWPVVLSKLKKEQISVHAVAGTGPNWSLKKLINDLDNVISEYDNIVFLLSDQKRLEFYFLKEEGHSTVVMYEMLKNDTLKLNEEQTYIGNYHREIKELAQTLGPMFLYENVKNITFLHLISKQFKKIRFVVFTCFDLDNYSSLVKDFGITELYTKFLKELRFDSLEHTNFYYMNIPINQMVKYYDHAFYSVPRKIYNHMSPSQNLKFAKLVYDIIMNKEPDTTWFENEPIKPIFIYE